MWVSGRQTERERERNNEIDGSHEAMTAGRPHLLMDDKCSVAMTVRIPRTSLSIAPS